MCQMSDKLNGALSGARLNHGALISYVEKAFVALVNRGPDDIKPLSRDVKSLARASRGHRQSVSHAIYRRH